MLLDGLGWSIPIESEEDKAGQVNDAGEFTFMFLELTLVHVGHSFMS